jgi:Ca2+-transporting ATPase
MAFRMVIMAVPMFLGTIYLFNGAYEGNIEYGYTMALTTLAVFCWFNAWNCRSDRASVIHDMLGNRYLIAATTLVIVLHLFAVYHPWFQNILHTVPLSLTDWLIILPVAFSIVVVEEVRKVFYRLTLERQSATLRA